MKPAPSSPPPEPSPPVPAQSTDIPGPRRPQDPSPAQFAEATISFDNTRLTRNIMARISNRHMEQMGRWYLRIRLVIGAVLVGAFPLGAYLRPFFRFDPAVALALGAATLAVNAAFTWAHARIVKRYWTEPERFHDRFQAFIFGQIAFDWIVLSALVVDMGGVTSGISHFFLIHCVMSASVLGAFHTLLYTMLSLALYAGLSVYSVVQLGADAREVATGGGLFLALMFSIIALLHLLNRMRHDVYAKYEASQAQLERLDVEKTEYMILVTHEIKAPLAVIMNQAKLIRDGYTGKIEAKTRDIVEKLIGRAGNLLLSINDILRFSNLNTCLDVREKFVRFKAGDHIARVMEKLQGDARIDLAAAERLDDELLGVPEQFEILMTNLLSNALKYSRAETRVKVDLANRGRNLTLRVADRGTGIAADELPNLFTPFFRTSDAVKFCPGGTGLGLSICRKICELNLGSIAVESTLGEGTAFTVEWPLFKTRF